MGRIMPIELGAASGDASVYGLIGTLVVVAGGLVGALAKARSENKTATASATEQLTDASVQIVGMQKNTIAELIERLDQQEAKTRSLERKLDQRDRAAAKDKRELQMKLDATNRDLAESQAANRKLTAEVTRLERRVLELSGKTDRP